MGWAGIVQSLPIGASGDSSRLPPLFVIVGILLVLMG